MNFLDLATIIANLRAWAWLVLALLLSHAGMAIPSTSSARRFGCAMEW